MCGKYFFNDNKTGEPSMTNVNYLIPKNQRPVWAPELEPLATHSESMTEIPLLGWVSAGQPVDIHDDTQHVSVPTSMVRKNTYALRVRGHSMIDDNIQDGDLIVIEKRETAQNGQSVVAMINGERVTLKKFYVEADGIRLQPANPDMAPIRLKNEEVQILGIVTGVIRMADAG
jgi:repressor LexA